MRMFRLALILLPALAAIAGAPSHAAQVTQVTVAPATPEPAEPSQQAEPAIASASSAITITLGATGDFERKTVHYGCEGDTDSLSVDYINAAPNYLALLPIEGSTLVFNTVLAASGARYAAGKYVWSTKGSDGSLFDLTQGPNAKPILTCSQLNDTP